MHRDLASCTDLRQHSCCVSRFLAHSFRYPPTFDRQPGQDAGMA